LETCRQVCNSPKLRRQTKHHSWPRFGPSGHSNHNYRAINSKPAAGLRKPVEPWRLLMSVRPKAELTGFFNRPAEAIRKIDLVQTRKHFPKEQWPSLWAHQPFAQAARLSGAPGHVRQFPDKLSVYPDSPIDGQVPSVRVVTICRRQRAGRFCLARRTEGGWRRPGGPMRADQRGFESLFWRRVALG
jgi:hypothetical protein